jgi:predicted O-methyltransferase YrrM
VTHNSDQTIAKSPVPLRTASSKAAVRAFDTMEVGQPHPPSSPKARQMDVVALLEEDRPRFHQQGTAQWDSLPETLRLIQRLAPEGGGSTLETGCGASTVVFAASGASHTAISPDPDEHRRVREYCEQIGVDHSRLRLIVGLSDEVLPSLPAERALDVAFIDGAHSFPYPAIDWYYVTRMLKIGGHLIFDDVPIPAVAPLFRHMKLEPNWRLDAILDNRAASFSLLAPPKPEEWSGQPFNQTYPDYSFVPLRLRSRLVAAHRLAQLKSQLATRYPRIRQAMKEFERRSTR